MGVDGGRSHGETSKSEVNRQDNILASTCDPTFLCKLILRHSRGHLHRDSMAPNAALLVGISGPSSSGKTVTTTTALQLRSLR
jgi:hypothetical protein